MLSWRRGALPLIAGMSVLSGVGVLAAALPMLVEPAKVAAPAVRGQRQSVISPPPCPVEPGLYRETVDDSQLELVFHAFDGNVNNDRRVALPNIFYGARASSRMTVDCSAAILSIPASQRAFRVDPTSGTVSEIPVVGGWGNHHRPLNDGRVVTWKWNTGTALFDPQTGEDISTQPQFDLLDEQGNTIETLPEGAYGQFLIADRSGRHFIAFTDPGIPETVTVLTRGQPDPTAVFPMSRTGVIVGADVSPSGHHVLITTGHPAGLEGYVTIYELGGGVVAQLRGNAAVFTTDNEIVLCRTTAAVRSDFGGRQSVIEAFDDGQLVQEAGPPTFFSPKAAACDSALL